MVHHRALSSFISNPETSSTALFIRLPSFFFFQFFLPPCYASIILLLSSSPSLLILTQPQPHIIITITYLPRHCVVATSQFLSPSVSPSPMFFSLCPPFAFLLLEVAGFLFCLLLKSTYIGELPSLKLGADFVLLVVKKSKSDSY